MPKADSVLSTQRRSVPLRKTAPTLRSPRSEPLPTIDPKTLPDLYCMGLDGDCLAPLIPDRAAVMIKKSEPFGVGDVVCIWFRPEVIVPGGPQSWLKRITMNAPPWVKFPYKDHPEFDVQGFDDGRATEPPMGYRIKCADILAVHKAVGYSPAGGSPAP